MRLAVRRQKPMPPQRSTRSMAIALRNLRVKKHPSRLRQTRTARRPPRPMRPRLRLLLRRRLRNRPKPPLPRPRPRLQRPAPPSRWIRTPLHLWPRRQLPHRHRRRRVQLKMRGQRCPHRPQSPHRQPSIRPRVRSHRRRRRQPRLQHRLPLPLKTHPRHRLRSGSLPRVIYWETAAPAAVTSRPASRHTSTTESAVAPQ